MSSFLFCFSITYILCNAYIFSNLAEAIDCEWSKWEIGVCSSSCGGGIRTNTRKKILEELNGGKCDGTTTTQEGCNHHECPGTKQYI